MLNLLEPTSDNLFLLFVPVLTTFLLYVAYSIIIPSQQKPILKKTNVVVYVHDNFTGHETSAITVAGKEGPTSDILNFGTIAIVDDPVTEGPARESKEIGRAQGLYVNSQLEGKAVYMAFSVVFTDGDFKGSSLEIQGADVYSMKQREFSVVSGTGFFRFVKGYGIMETEFIDMANLRAIIKLNITVKHF